jgi:hypothetical protein
MIVDLDRLGARTSSRRSERISRGSKRCDAELVMFQEWLEMDKKERLRKARRVVAVQASLERAAAWRLIDLDHEDVRLKERRTNLVRFLGNATPLGDTFSTATMRRLQGLAEDRAALKLEKDRCAARRREERIHLRCAETIVETLDRAVREIDDLRELESVIEAALENARVRSKQA